MVNCTLKYSIKYKKYMPIRVFIPCLLSVCATITIRMDINLSDHFFLEFDSDPDLKISTSNDKLPMYQEFMARFARNKNSVNKLVDLFHI